MKRRIENFLSNENVVDLIKKLVVIFSLIYLSFFALESILPGVVVEAFNLNLLLFLIITMIAYLFFFQEKKVQKLELRASSKKRILFFMATIFILTMFVVLFRITLLETAIYVVGALILMKWGNELFS